MYNTMTLAASTPPFQRFEACDVTNMALVEGVKCPLFHTLPSFWTSLSVWIDFCTNAKFSHISQCGRTFASEWVIEWVSEWSFEEIGVDSDSQVNRPRSQTQTLCNNLKSLTGLISVNCSLRKRFKALGPLWVDESNLSVSPQVIIWNINSTVICVRYLLINLCEHAAVPDVGTSRSGQYFPCGPPTRGGRLGFSRTKQRCECGTVTYQQWQLVSFFAQDIMSTFYSNPTSPRASNFGFHSDLQSSPSYDKFWASSQKNCSF